MNTQKMLFERSAEMPEGLYLDLMNQLKLDFDNNKVNVIVIPTTLPKHIVIRKSEMIQNIIRESVNWENREEILLKITGRCMYSEVKDLCLSKGLPTMKINPKWTTLSYTVNRDQLN